MAKKKKNLTLPILLGVLAVLGGSYGAIRAYNASQAAKEAQGSESEEKTQIVFEGLQAEDITALSYVAGGDILSFQKDGDTWYLAEDKTIPLTQAKFSNMTSALVNLEEKQTVEESLDNLSAFGLDEPANTITFRTADQEHTLYVGDKNAITNDFYFYIAGENKVRTTGSSLPTSFQTLLTNYYTAQTLPELNKSELRDIELTNSYGFLAVRNLLDGDPFVDYMGGNTWFAEDENGSRSVLDADAESTLTDRVTGLTLESCVDYKPTDEALQTYGLMNPAATVKIRYIKTEKEEIPEGSTEASGSDAAKVVEKEGYLELLIGSKEEGGRYYAKTSDSAQVCLISAADAEYFLELNQRAFTNLSPCMINIADVDRLVLEVDGKTKEYAITREEVKNEDSDAGTTVETYYIDDVETDSSEFKSQYQTIIGLKGEQALSANDALKGSDAAPEVTMTFYRNTDQLKEIRFELAPYDSSFYQLSINGTPSLLVNKFDAAKIKELMKAGE